VLLTNFENPTASCLGRAAHRNRRALPPTAAHADKMAK